jgi:hypothetical protein
MVEPSFDYHEQLAELRRIIVHHFSIGELQTLCFDLGVDYESLPGEGKADKAREFVFQLVRERRMAQFIEICRRLRPDIPLDFEVERHYETSDTRRTALLDAMFRRATRRHMLGDVGYALQLYRELQRIDPTYPRIEATIAAAEREMRAGYVDPHGRVLEDRLIARSMRPSVLFIVIRALVVAVVLILLVFAYLWLKGLVG